MNMVLAAVLLLQDKDAEEALKKIEEQILRSKTVRMEFSLSTGADDKKNIGSGSLLIKEGNKVRFEMETGEGEQKTVLKGGSNGTLWWGVWGPLGRSDEVVPTLSLAFRMAFARVSVTMAGSFCIECPIRKDVTTLDISTMLAISDLKAGDVDGTMKTLSYQVQVNDAFLEGARDPVRVKAWYDPKTFKPVKRQVTRKRADKEVVVLETYTGLAFDEEIPDGKFALPKEDK
jgi:outer membrane lipoprotein-sorting protein